MSKIKVTNNSKLVLGFKPSVTWKGKLKKGGEE